jgi:hypothetical protein
LGVKINPKAKNPFAPSAMLVRIAVANTLKYMELNMASEQAQILNQIMGISKTADKDTIDNWDTICSESSADRGIRYLYTGNLLQAFGGTSKDDKARLVSYTTADGGVKKGLLLPESYAPKESPLTSVPLSVAAKCIRALGHNQSIVANNGLSFMRTGRGITIFTTGLSRQKYDRILTNPELLEYIENSGGFQKISASWKGDIDDNNLEVVCKIIYELTNCSVGLYQNQLEMIKHLLHKETEQPIPVFPKLMELEIKLFMMLKQENPTGFEGLGMATVRDSFSVFREYYPFDAGVDPRKKILLEMVREIANKSNNFTNTTAFDEQALDVRSMLEKERINPADWARQNKTFHRSESDVVRWVASEINDMFSYETTTTTTLPQPQMQPQADDDRERRLRLAKAVAIAKLKILKLKAARGITAKSTETDYAEPQTNKKASEILTDVATDFLKALHAFDPETISKFCKSLKKLLKKW